MNSILVFETVHLGQAYEALQTLPAGLESFEVISGSGVNLVILQGPEQRLRAYQESLSGTAHPRLVSPWTETLEKARLGLENPQLEKTFIVFESSRIGDVFEAAARLEKNGFNVFDLRVLRGSDLKAHLFATGDSKVGKELSDLHGTLTQIHEPSSFVRQHFEL